MSAISQVSICNSALVKVGAERISSIDQDTKSARILKAVYAQVRDAVLAAHPWNFAIKRAVLAPVSSTPAFEFDFAYDLPNDCLAVLSLYDGATDFGGDESIDYVVEGRQILTDEESISLRYIYQNVDESSWNSYFAEAFAWRLAKEVAYNLTQSLALASACESSYQRELSLARSRDGAEDVMKGLVADVWIKSRK